MKIKYFKNAILHFKTISMHKIEVMRLCFKAGLIKEGLLHDLSKYSLREFITGIKYYQGNRSPNAIEKIEEGYSRAWLNHKGRNRHHFEYWIDYGVDANKGLIGMKMPLRCVYEMLFDRIAASKIYYAKDYNTGIPYEYYKTKEKAVVMHEDTKKLLEKLLIINKEKGEEKLIEYIKNSLHRRKRK